MPGKQVNLYVHVHVYTVYVCVEIVCVCRGVARISEGVPTLGFFSSSQETPLTTHLVCMHNTHVHVQYIVHEYMWRITNDLQDCIGYVHYHHMYTAGYEWRRPSLVLLSLVRHVFHCK